MKRATIVSAIAAAFLVGGSGVAQAKELRIGVVNMRRAVSETKEGKQAEQRLKALKKKLEAELNRKLKEFYKEEAENRKKWKILKDDERRKRAGASRKKFETLQKRYVQAERQLLQKKTREMLKIQQKLTRVIQKVAKKSRFDYIFANAAVLWAPRHTDITNQVIRLYNGGK